MNAVALASAALAFPSLIILGGVVVALRNRQPGWFGVAACWLGLGVIATILTAVWVILADQMLLGRVPVNLYYAFITAALPEEGFRFLVIRLGLRHRPAVGLQVAMLKGSLVGLTFGSFEHVLYAVDKGWGTWLARSFTSVPYHTLAGAVLGYFSAVAMRTRRPWGLTACAALVVVHGLADWPWLASPEGSETSSQSDFVSSGWAGNIASLVVTAALAVTLFRRAGRADAGGGERGDVPARRVDFS